MGYCSEIGESLEEMIDHAYAALQKAQQQGRNQIAWYDPIKDQKITAS